MKILIEGQNLENYLARCHEAFRTGLKSLFDVRFFGKGYPGYRFYFSSFDQIITHLFPDTTPDIIIAESLFPIVDKYPSIKKYKIPQYFNCLKGIILADYWTELSEQNKKLYFDKVVENKIDFILSYFPQPLEIYINTIIENKLIYMPPSFDPSIFNDWELQKQYDVGFLAAGTTEYTEFYPERYSIHKRLLKEQKINYLWAEHPGWENNYKSSSLVGKNYSKAINSCKIFITTGGILKNAHAKYVEILASKTLLMAEEPFGYEKLGLIDNVNYIKITKDNIIDKIYYYLSKPELIDQIANEGYRLAINKHNCYTRALDFYNEIQNKLT